MTQDCQTNGLQGNLIGMEILYSISSWSFLEPSIQPYTQTGSYLKVNSGVRLTAWESFANMWLRYLSILTREIARNVTAHSTGMLCQHMA